VDLDVASAAAAPILTGFGIGLALAGAPGAVQAVLLGEAVRGGVRRGIQALIGANLTFGLLLLLLVVGVSIATPNAETIRILWVAGGATLLFLAADAVRTAWDRAQGSSSAQRIPAAIRGSAGVLLNPGAWLFLAVVAAPLLATGTRTGGTSLVIAAALAMMIGAGIGDLGVVLFGGLGLRRVSGGLRHGIRMVLAVILGVLGAVLLATGLRG
jgi:threonine/homoserine/homoserine lactone efflux protein